MVEISLEGLWAPTLEGGLQRAVLQQLVPDLREAHAELMTRRSRDIGFLDLPFDDEGLRACLVEAKRLRSIADDIVVLGIGGSSLGGQAVAHALGYTAEHDTRVHFLDNIDPDTIARLLPKLQPERTAIIAVTKSGTTIETLAQLLIVWRWLKASLGQGEAHQHMVFITDPARGLLRELAGSEGIRSFPIPPNVGGRFSVLAAVGLLPAAVMGVDVEGLVRGARAMADQVVDPTQDILDNPACKFAAGALLANRHLNARSIVMMPYADSLRVMTLWFVQLWAESLGKRVNRRGEEVRVGQTPIAALGATDQHAQLQLFVEGPKDKVVTLLTVDEYACHLPIPPELPGHEEVAFLHGRDLADLLDAERRATRAALLDAGVPVIDMRIPTVDAAQLGALFVLFEAATAITGFMLGIDPFDQPGVEAGKSMAMGLLGRRGYEQAAARVTNREQRR